MLGRRTTAIAATGAAITILVGTFLPWLRSGARHRSSYDLFAIVERLGFAPGGIVGWAVRLWPALPLLLVLVVVEHWRPTGRFARLLAIVAAVYAAATAGAIVLAPDVGLFGIGPGPWVTLLGALALITVTLASGVTRGSDARGAS